MTNISGSIASVKLRKVIISSVLVNQVRKNSLNIKFLGRIFLGHPGPRRRDIPDNNFMQVAYLCCFRQGVAGMSRDLGRDVPGAPGLGSAEGGHPDLFRFVPISPFSSDLFRFALLVFRNTPICSDLLRFLPICSDLFSEQIRTNQGNPFLPTPFANIGSEQKRPGANRPPEFVPESPLQKGALWES